MNCRRFEKMLADFQEGTLTLAERSAVDSHLEKCAACRRLLDIARGVVDIIPEDRRDGLTRSILGCTSGSVCPRVESSLWAFVRGELDRDDSQLIASHVDYCSSCRSIAGDFTMLQEALPAFAEIEPGESFTQEVIGATSGWRRYQPSLKIRFFAWWKRAVQRPRFSFEAAYLGTLVLFCAFSILSLAFRNDASGKTSVAIVHPTAKYLHSVCLSAKASVSYQLSEFASVSSLKRQTVSKSLSEMVKNYGKAPASILGKSVQAIQVLQKKMAGALFASWARLSFRNPRSLSEN
jgi:anti-sigma factor RsiW